MLHFLVVESDCKSVIAKNIIYYRKQLNMTQAELAEKLKYSDKAISKWERGDAIPDVVVLTQMASIFGVDLDIMCSKHWHERPIKKETSPSTKKHLKHLLISLLSVGLVWLVATVVFVFGSMIWPNFEYFWMAFIYAIPCSAIVLIVFNAIWGRRLIALVLVSILVWTAAMCLDLSVPIDNSFLFFIIGVPLQILVFLWYLLMYIMKDKKRISIKIKNPRRNKCQNQQ